MKGSVCLSYFNGIIGSSGLEVLRGFYAGALFSQNCPAVLGNPKQYGGFNSLTYFHLPT